MWKTSLMLLALGATCVLAFDRSMAQEKLVQYRVRSQNLHIDHLEEKIGKLEDSFDALGGHVKKWDVSMLKVRVRRSEGKRCDEEREVSCGGDFPECVSHHFVCDGRVDCHNGKDEDEKVCNSEMVHVGSTYQGVVEWNTCQSFPDHNIIFTVTAVHHPEVITSRVYVRATTIIDNQKMGEGFVSTTYSSKGYYIFASRQLVLLPYKQEQPYLQHPYGMKCSFHFGDTGHADCTINEVATLTECAKFRVVKV